MYYSSRRMHKQYFLYAVVVSWGIACGVLVVLAVGLLR